VAESWTVSVPRETVNDDVVTLARWHVAAGDRVRAGAPLCDIETSKAAIEIEAEREGYVELLVTEGDEVAVGGEVCRLHAAPVAATAPALSSTAATKPGADGAAISRKARALIEEHGLDPAAFSHLAMVREADVIRYLEQRTRAGGAASSAPAAAAGAPKQSGGWFGDAQSASKDRGHGLVWLAFNYVFRNWLLGNLVPIAPRGVILWLHRLRGVKIGRDCYIDPTAIIETAYPENITIGDDVRVTARACIMTHIKAPNYLRNTGIMPVVLKPVVLEDHSFIGVNSVILPGVRVGKASVVASGAVVSGNVPPYTMVAGNPAKIVRRFPSPEGESSAGP